ncbi:MAG: nucleotidyl transferase AbiEii/AbiGii toxin family protein [Verrucomicrobiae bacterium]|nr:nucleotidyl transferase AbiEii/AbiGii toxin family protein [Verrucomicrobiae bacterium]
MVDEPRTKDDYTPRVTEAAERVLVDVMQVLASFQDCLVLVGGWVPDLLLDDAEEPHVKSGDVDLALDVAKLNEGRYAEMLKLLLDTGRYRQGEKDFQLVTEVDLKDGEEPVVVEVEFLAPKDVKTEKNDPKLIENFRVLKADGCGAAFHSPLTKKLQGKMVSGARNTVTLQVASVPDFLVMKSFALNGRDKPKDAYDICFCLDFYKGGISELADAWRERKDGDQDVAKAIGFLEEKFETVDSFGPMQVVAFHNSPNEVTQEEQARRSYELVQSFLSLVKS